jgi:hypothetical protein
MQRRSRSVATSRDKLLFGSTDTRNYRNMATKELMVFAEQRKVELARMGIPLGNLWEEVLHRLSGGEPGASSRPLIPIVHG